LMTPAEILGVPTPEKILGIPQRDAGAGKNQTAIERYLEREYAAQTGATNRNAIYNRNPSEEWNASSREQARLNPGFSSPENNTNSSAMNSFFGETPDNRNAEANQNAVTVWQKPFASPSVAPAQTPEQLAAAEGFQKLLQPHSSQSSVATFSSYSKTTPDTFLMQPAASPAGNSFVPLSSGIGMPTGVQPLPGIFGEKKSSTTPVAPEWKPKSPPWMSSIPQSGTMSQREF
jgi:hypothetical protein